MAIRFTVHNVNDYIKNKGNTIILLTDVYISAKTKMNFKCKDCQREFTTSFSDLKQYKKLCPGCSQPNYNMSYEKIEEYIKNNRKDLILLDSKKIYKNKSSKLNFQCVKCNYTYMARYASVQNAGAGCSKCARKKYNLNDVKKYILTGKPLTLLSTKYINSTEKLKFECNVCNFIFDISFKSLKQYKGHCQKCSGKYIYSKEEIVEEIKTKRPDLLLLESEYKTVNSILNFKCLVCNNIFTSSFKSVCKSKSCKKCSDSNRIGKQINAGYTYDDIKTYIENKRKDLLLLSDNYKNTTTHLHFKCVKCNNEFKSQYRSIKNNNTGCPKCIYNKFTIDNVKDFLKTKRKNITLLSDKYVDANKPLNWQCKKCSCKWRTSYSAIKNNNHGCPNCASFKSEKLTRKIIQEITDLTFPKKRPKCLKGLELDGYNKDLKVAFEYNGKQHYKYVPFYHRNGIKDFIEQHFRDVIKKQLCSENGIELISIPYKYGYRNPDKLREFIHTLLEVKGILDIL